MKKLLPIILLSLIIAIACESLISFQLYSSDLFDLSNGNSKELFVNARVDNEVSEDDFNKAKDILSNNFRDAKNFRMEEGDLNDRIVADYKIPVVLAKNYQNSDIDLLTLVLNPIDDKTFEIGLAFNNDLYDRLNVYIESEFMSSLDLEESVVSFDFQNDLSATIKATWQSVYINGKAVPISHATLLDKRDTQNVKLSEVFLRAFKDNEDIVYFGKIEISSIK